MKELTDIIMKIKHKILDNNIYLFLFCFFVCICLILIFLILGIQTGEYIYSDF